MHTYTYKTIRYNIILYIIWILENTCVYTQSYFYKYVHAYLIWYISYMHINMKDQNLQSSPKWRAGDDATAEAKLHLHSLKLLSGNLSWSAVVKGMVPLLIWKVCIVYPKIFVFLSPGAPNKEKIIMNASLVTRNCSLIWLMLAPASWPFTFSIPWLRVAQERILIPALSLSDVMGKGPAAQLDPNAFIVWSKSPKKYGYNATKKCWKWAISVCARLMVFAPVWLLFAPVLRTICPHVFHLNMNYGPKKGPKSNLWPLWLGVRPSLLQLFTTRVVS